MRIAIFGAGGVGGWLTARLRQSGADVILIARGAHGEAICNQGLWFLFESETIQVQVPVYTDVAAAVDSGESVDCCVLCVKTFQVRSVAEACAPLLARAGGFVVTTQNGVDAPHEACAVLGAANVVGGSCKCLAWIESPGIIKMAGPPAPAKWTFGETFDASTGLQVKDARSGRVSALYEIVSRSQGINVAVGLGEVAPCMWTALWEKAVSMCSLGGLGALTRTPIEVCANSKEVRPLLRKAMLEVVTVASASGFPLAQDAEVYVDNLLNQLAKTKPGYTASTTRDVICGRKSEICELSGGIVRAARCTGVDVPTHELILAALMPQELRARGEHMYDLEGVPGGVPHVSA